jgi:hypothetical protein
MRSGHFHQPSITYSRTREMWKTCQEARPKTEVMTPHSTPLPPQYPQRILAVFSTGLGILIIEGKKQKRLSPTAGPFSFSAHMNALPSNPLPAPGSWLPAPCDLSVLGLLSPNYFRSKCVDDFHFAFKYIHATLRRNEGHPLDPPTKSPRQATCFHEDATVQNAPATRPPESAPCHSPIPRGEGGPGRAPKVPVPRLSSGVLYPATCHLIPVTCLLASLLTPRCQQAFPMLSSLSISLNERTPQ